MLSISSSPATVSKDDRETNYHGVLSAAVVTGAPDQSTLAGTSTFQFKSGFRVLEDRRPKPSKYVSVTPEEAANGNWIAGPQNLIMMSLRQIFNAIGLVAKEDSNENGI